MAEPKPGPRAFSFLRTCYQEPGSQCRIKCGHLEWQLNPLSTTPTPRAAGAGQEICNTTQSHPCKLGRRAPGHFPAGGPLCPGRVPRRGHAAGAATCPPPAPHSGCHWMTGRWLTYKCVCQFSHESRSAPRPAPHAVSTSLRTPTASHTATQLTSSGLHPLRSAAGPHPCACGKEGHAAVALLTVPCGTPLPMYSGTTHSTRASVASAGLHHGVRRSHKPWPSAVSLRGHPSHWRHLPRSSMTLPDLVLVTIHARGSSVLQHVKAT